MANILQRLRSAFSSRPLGQSPIPIGQTPIYPVASMQTYIRAFQENATVFTIVDLMSRKFGFIPRYLYKVDAEGTAQEKSERKAAQRKYHHQVKMKNPNLRAKDLSKLLTKAYQDDVVEDSPLSKLLSRPNEYQGSDSYYTLLYAFRKLTGNSFEWLNRGDNDSIVGDARYDLPVLERHVLPSQFMTINVDRAYLFGQITGYTLYDSGQPIYFAKEDILHWKSSNPTYDSYNFTHLYGLSPLAPGRKLITQDESQVDAAVAMYQHGGARGVLYNEDMNDLTKEQVAAMDSAIDTKINNRSQKSAVAALPGKWGYLYTGQNAVDMDLVEAQDKTFQRIANLLGANPQLWETKTTFNNVEQARKDLITNAILPDAASYRDEENRVLLRAFGLTQTQFCIDIDVTDLPELQDDMEKLATRTNQNDNLTPNEKRQEMGFEPLPDPNMDVVFIPNNKIPIEDAVLASSTLDPGSADNYDNGSQVSNSSQGQSSSGNSKRLPAAEVNEIWRKTSTGN